MAVRINWDIYEAVILLDALIAVREGRLSRKAAAQAVSRELRERAVANGIEIDDTYRNVNGINWQLSLIESEFNNTFNYSGRVSSKEFVKAVDLYKNDRAEYDRLLSQARKNKSASQASESFQEDFLKWLEGRVSPEQLSTYYLIYTDLNEYMLKKGISKADLFTINSQEEVRRVAAIMHAHYSFSHKKPYSNAMVQSALSMLSAYAKLNFKKEKGRPLSESVAQILEAQPDAPDPDQSETTGGLEPAQTAFQIEDDTPEPQSDPAPQGINTVDFNDIGDYSFTKPVFFNYRGKMKKQVNAWADVYASAVRCLNCDYPDIISSYNNSNFNGSDRFDITKNASLLINPKEVGLGLYLETNYCADRTLKKIRTLLNLCGLDYSDIQITYRNTRESGAQAEQGNNTPETASVPEPESTPEPRAISQPEPAQNDITGESQNAKSRFIEWASDNSISDDEVQKTLNGVDICRETADLQGIGGDIWTSGVAEASAVIFELTKNSFFIKFDSFTGGELTSALKMYIKFLEQNKERSESRDHDAGESADVQADPEGRFNFILEKYYAENGYDLGRSLTKAKFENYYSEEYGEQPSADIDGVLRKIGVTLNGKVYPKSKFKDSELLTDIINSIEDALRQGISAVYAQAVYDKYEDEINTEFNLYGAAALADLIEYTPHRFLSAGGYYYLSGRIADPKADLLNLMRSYDEPQSLDIIKKDAYFLTSDQVHKIINKSEEIIFAGDKSYFYAPNFPLGEADVEQIAGLIVREAGGGSINAKALRVLIERELPDISEYISAYSAAALRNFLKYKLEGRFNFNGDTIFVSDDFSAADPFAEFAKGRSSFTLSELEEIKVEHGKPVINLNAVLKYAYRISHSDFVNKNSLEFDIAGTDSALAEMVDGDYAPLADLNFFNLLPSAPVPWNEFLLESFLHSASREFKLIHTNFSKDGVYGAAVKRSSDIKDYNDLAARVLSEDGAPDKPVPAIDYLVDRGFQKSHAFASIDGVLRNAKRIKEERNAKL